ncbi:hypothetical protein ACVWWP_000504 [Bradyrhizobium sp. LM3.6]
MRRYSMIVPGAGFSGYVAVQIPENAIKIYTDEAVRQMFASVATRKQVSADEQLALMPFKITDLAEFKDVRTLAPGSSIILADGDESTGYESKPFMILGVIGATPQQADDRARFAQEAALQIPGVRESRVTMSEPLRINGQQGFETRIDGISGKDKDGGDRGAVDPLQQRWRFAAHHRQRPARPVAGRLHPLPRGTRRHPAEGLKGPCADHIRLHFRASVRTRAELGSPPFNLEGGGPCWIGETS